MNGDQETYDLESQASPHAGQAAQLGLLLRKAREARGLGIDEVVQALKFGRRQIEALEANDLAALPGNVFVRGSIRSYARFLKIDPEPLLDLLAQDVPVVEADVRPPENMGRASPRRGIRQIPPLVGVSVVLLLLAAGLVAWHLFGQTTVDDIRTADGSEAVPKTTGEQVTTVPAAPIAASDARGAVSAPASTVPVASLAGQRGLALTFRGTCWVEIRDASQQIILTGQFDEGSRQTVAGKPPFQLVLGSAANVDLAYDGRPVDLKPHTRAEVARLTLE